MEKLNLKSSECKSVFDRYPKAVVHLRQQHRLQRLGLVFGAGIGRDLKFPDWEELLKTIAKRPEVDGEAILRRGRSQASVAQQLFQKYRMAAIHKARVESSGRERLAEMRIRAAWRDIVHTCLYQGIPEEIAELLKTDKYLQAFVPIIKQSPLTVTYNFDDTIQRMLAAARDEDELSAPAASTYWSGNVQLHAKTGAVIYHPNGYLPRGIRERPSDQLVFLEDSFADQLIDSISGQYASLSTHLASNTCLFVGLSLDDPTLKHLLRQGARSFPGHFHYLVRHRKTADTTSDTIHDDVESQVNFDVYNLNTLYLTSEEINALATLITSDDDKFRHFAEEMGHAIGYRYFIVGAVSAGKSTTISQFRSLATHGEWTTTRAPGMEKAYQDLTDEERDKIDKYVAEQIALKDKHLKNHAQTGLNIMDRAPLDAFAFTPHENWKDKAVKLKCAIAPGHAAKRELEKGHVILLVGDPKTMEERAVSLNKKTDADKLDAQQEELKIVYGGLRPEEGLTIIDTDRKSMHEIVKEVAAVIHRKPYVAADIHARLLEIERDGYD